MIDTTPERWYIRASYHYEPQTEDTIIILWKGDDYNECLENLNEILNNPEYIDYDMEVNELVDGELKIKMMIECGLNVAEEDGQITETAEEFFEMAKAMAEATMAGEEGL